MMKSRVPRLGRPAHTVRAKNDRSALTWPDLFVGGCYAA